MGGNSPSQHYQGEGQGGEVNFVQGIRLSDRVVNRMRQSPLKHNGAPAPHLPQSPPATPIPTPSVEHLPSPPPPQEVPSTPPSVEPVKLIPPSPVKFHSLPNPPVAPPPPVETKTLDASAPTSPPPRPSLVEPVYPPSSFDSPPLELEAPSTPPAAEHVLKTAIVPPPVESALLGPSASPLSSEHVKPAPPANVEPTAVAPSVLETGISSTPSVETFHSPPAVKSTAVEALIPPSRVDPAPVEPLSPQVEPIVLPVMASTVDFSAVENEAVAAVPPPAVVLEKELRQKIKEEMQRSLEVEISQRRQQLQRELEDMRAQAQAEAKAAAQAQVEEQVKKTLAAEKAAYTENLTDSIMKERMKTEDEGLLVQLYWMELKAHQLEEREKELKKRDAIYKKHVAKLEAKCTEFYKVTAESFQRGKEETLNHFARINSHPVCGDLQRQILDCYKENIGKTLSCSRLASAYMQCVDNAKKNKLSTGG